MAQHDKHRARGQDFQLVDDGQIGPDADAWPGEQTRRIEERYRSWRQDRYREYADERSHERRARGQHPPRGDGGRHRHDYPE